MYLKGGVVKKLLALALANFGLLFNALAVADGSLIGYNTEGSGQYVGNTIDSATQFSSNVLNGGSYNNNNHQTFNYEGVDSQGNFPETGDRQNPDQEFCCGEPQEHPCGDIYCLYCKYEPCYYNEWHTINEPKCYEKKCCRYIAKEYEKTCVKYVPQYYTQTCCRYEPEYFTTTEVRNCPRKVCERKCKWVPKYYYKHIKQNECEPGCPPVCQ